MTKIIKIGTRESELAMWQANLVKSKLDELGYTTQIIPITSSGDIELDKPLYEMGITGIFTKTLDVAMLRGQVDIAVHSLKDVPTALPKGIVQAAVLARADSSDILVYQDNADVITPYEGVIATGSLRRKAQWLNRYPKHTVVNLRGNVNTRLQKLKDHHWNGAIFAAAGLQRLNKTPANHTVLDWMVPAPAQGAVMVAALEADAYVREACAQLNDEETELCTRIEREFLRELEGGCTAPIGAIAELSNSWRGDRIEFTGVLLSRDGQTRLEVNETAKTGDPVAFAKKCAQRIIDQGGKNIIAKDALLAEQAEAEAINSSAETEQDSSESLIVNIKSSEADYKKTPLVSAGFTDEPDDGIYTVVSTRALTDEQVKGVRDNVIVQGMDFITTVLLPIPPEAVRTDSMIITSQTTVRALLASFPRLNLRFKNLYCVGDKTTQMVEERLGRVIYTAPSARALGLYLSKHMKSPAITYFCGNLRRDDLPQMLAASHIRLTEVPAYETRYTGSKIENDFSGVMFYSPSGVRSYVQANSADKTAFCIGETTAHEARTYFDDVHVAEKTTTEHVIKLVNTHYAPK